MKKLRWGIALLLFLSCILVTVTSGYKKYEKNKCLNNPDKWLEAKVIMKGGREAPVYVAICDGKPIKESVTFKWPFQFPTKGM